MTIEHDIKNKRFNAKDGGAAAGYIAYEPAEGKVLRAVSTWVDPEYRGRNVAGLLLDALAGYARENAYNIEPVCSYVVAAFKKYPEKYGDVAENG